jgi:hypothetical protein
MKHLGNMTLKGIPAMRNPSLLALLATLALGAPYAAAQTAPQTSPGPPATAADLDKQTAQMQENVKRMQRQMDRIHEAKDPKARHELMDEHAKTMQENVGMMRGMGGSVMTDTMREHQTGAWGSAWRAAAGAAAIPWRAWIRSSKWNSCSAAWT